MSSPPGSCSRWSQGDKVGMLPVMGVYRRSDLVRGEEVDGLDKYSREDANFNKESHPQLLSQFNKAPYSSQHQWGLPQNRDRDKTLSPFTTTHRMPDQEIYQDRMDSLLTSDLKLIDI